MKKRKYNRVQKLREEEERRKAALLAEAKEKKLRTVRFLSLILISAAMVTGAYVASKLHADKKEEKESQVLELSPEEVGNDTPEKSLEDIPIVITRENSLDTLIAAYAEYRGLEPESFGYYIENMETGEVYTHNEKKNFIAASTYKLPLAMLWMDKVVEGECTLESEYVFNASRHEDGGPIGYNHQYGDKITLKEIIDNTIIYSDNSGGHIMFEELGGYEEYKKLVTKYCVIPQEKEFFLRDNYYNAEFMNSVLKQLYYHPKTYALLIEDMKIAEPERYLNSQLNSLAAQKYGSYGEAQNAVGIVYDGHPYTIAIYTTFGGYGSAYIGEINEIVYRYFNEFPNE